MGFSITNAILFPCFLSVLIMASPRDQQCYYDRICHLSSSRYSGFAQPHWPVGLAGLLEFLDMPAGGLGQFGGEDCSSCWGAMLCSTCSIAPANCLTSRWPEPVSHLRCQSAYSKSWIE